MLFKFQKIVGCIEPWVKNRDTNRIVSLCIVTALIYIYIYTYIQSFLIEHLNNYELLYTVSGSRFQFG